MAINIDSKIYDPVAQLIASGGGIFTPNSIPGSSIQNGTITSTQLASGAAASNINSGPPGAVNATQIGNGITGTQLASGAAASNINSGPPGAINQSQIAGGPFLPLAGGTMSGAIVQPIAPVNPNDLTNKAYVDAQVSAGTPDATTATKGKIQLAGDLGGTGTTAAAPIISNNAITNLKINPGPINTNTVKGTGSSATPVVTDLALSGLTITGNTLSVTPIVFNYTTGRVSNTPFSVTKPAYVSYTYKLTGITTSIRGILSINTPVNVDICEVNYVPPAAATPFDYTFTLSGMVPANTPLELDIIRDGTSIVGLASSASEEVLFPA